ncbi:MAG: hypothetical protein IPP14_04640 [Planctomycetes bacterium]|nr:hypothetical protein [Planctomycetota bacterium]
MESATPSARRSWRFRGPALALVLAAVAVLVWLMVRGCGDAPEAVPRGYDYFHAKVEELGRDPERVKAFVEADIQTIEGAGNVKGPLATLWNGAGTEREKAQLQDVLLACCDPAMDSAEAWRTRGANDETVKLSIVLEAGTEGKTTATEAIDGYCATFAGAGHSLEVAEDGTAKLTVRTYGAEPEVRAINVKEAYWAQLRFTLSGDGKPREIVRELWNKDNRSGPTWGLPGDRHDFIVLPSRVSKFVREKEELRLKEAKREGDADAKAYLALLDYCLQSDEILAALEKENGVTARFDLPRILILSKFNLPIFVGGPCDALDLRLNYTSFEGEKVAAYSSVQTRSFTEAGLETAWLAKYTGAPCTSAHDVISALREDYPDQPARRLQAVLDALAAAANQPAGTQLVFSASDPVAAKGAVPPEITLSKLEDGKWSIRSGALNAAMVADLDKNPDMPRLPLKDGLIDGATDSHERLALMVEVGLMAADVKPQVGARYVLQTRLIGAPRALVVEGASFTFAWGSGEDRVDQHVVVRGCGGSLVLEARVQSGIRPVNGTRTIDAAALSSATLHNPWYAQGDDLQKDATTFVVSRSVYEALKAGKSSDFAVAGRYATVEDAAEGKPRPITWTGKIEPLGTGSVKVRINNKEETVAILRAKAGEREIAILDDAQWPVGMADRLLEVNSGIRCRLLDTGGTPIGGAEVSIEDAKATTAFDGSFTLAPRKADGYGRLKASVKRGEDSLGEAELDLSAPGLGEVTLTVNRPLKDLLFIHPREREKLAPLPLSDQVKRHANAAFDQGRCVMIPAAMLNVGGEEDIAFYSFDPATGENIGVMETGLNGSMQAAKNAWKDAAKDTAKEAWDNRDDIAEGGLPPIHMLRGAIVAWFTYCSYRLEGSSNAEAIMRMLNDMGYWEENTNLFSRTEEAIGGDAGAEARKRLAGAIGGNMDGGAAAVAFKCGYLGSAAFLAKFMADRGNDE